MRKEQFITRVQKHSGINDRKKCNDLCAVVFDLLSHRLTEDESRDLWSQLPSGLKEIWDYKHTGKVLKLHRDEFIKLVMERGELSSTEQAEKVTKAIFRAIKEQISIGETSDVTSQLPTDLKDLWGSA